MERGEQRDVERTAYPETIAGRRLNLREKLIAKVISRDEKRAYKEDSRDDDDNGRKQQENEAHGNPPKVGFRLVNENTTIS